MPPGLLQRLNEWTNSLFVVHCWQMLLWVKRGINPVVFAMVNGFLFKWSWCGCLAHTEVVINSFHSTLNERHKMSKHTRVPLNCTEQIGCEIKHDWQVHGKGMTMRNEYTHSKTVVDWQFTCGPVVATTN